MTKHTKQPKNKQQPKIIQSLFDELHTNERTNKQTSKNLDDDYGIQNFAVLFNSLIVIVKLFGFDIEYLT